MDKNMISWSGSYDDVSPSKEIFVVDDDEDVGDLLAGALAPVGYPVTNFTDAEPFLNAVRTRVPICVFLDIVMPRRSGMEILKELCAQNFWAPIFLISARDDVETVVEAMKSGAHDYIRKPFDPHLPALQAREAIGVWSRHRRGRTVLDSCEIENCEWFRLTPSERDVLLLMRSFET